MKTPESDTRSVLQLEPEGHVDHPKILVVDDVVDNLEMISELFSSEPWQVETCDNAKQAWITIKRWHPDLVLLDVMMPEFSGHHVCTALRSNPDLDDVRVAFLTAVHTSKDDIKRGLEMGADDYICKPIDGGVLCDRVRALLHPRWRKQQEAAEDGTETSISAQDETR